MIRSADISLSWIDVARYDKDKNVIMVMIFVITISHLLVDKNFRHVHLGFVPDQQVDQFDLNSFFVVSTLDDFDDDDDIVIIYLTTTSICLVAP